MSIIITYMVQLSNTNGRDGAGHRNFREQVSEKPKLYSVINPFMYEVRWLTTDVLVKATEHEKLEHALRDACQLSPFYATRFEVTRTEVWGPDCDMLLQMPVRPYGPE